MSTPSVKTIDRAAKEIKQFHDPKYGEIADLIGDRDWFREYLQVCLNHPFGNSILGAIVFGWMLRDKCQEIEAEAGSLIHRA